MLWKCTVCGYTNTGDKAPDPCPKCGSPAEKAILVSEEDAQKIFISDRTNDIHMKIAALSMEILALCDEGIKLNLDPGCVSVFSKAKQEVWVMKQRSKAEIVTHIAKGKW